VHPATMSTQWRSGFTEDGQFLAYSTGGASTAERETLYVIPTAMIGTAEPTMIATGVSRWTLSADGTKWFYLKDFNYNVDGEPSGTLYMRDFAGGTAAGTETRVASTLIKGGTAGGVGAFNLIINEMDQDVGVGVLQEIVAGRGNYLLINNPAGNLDDPMNVRMLLTDIGSVPIYSPDLRYSYYNKEFDQQVGTADSHILNYMTGASCALTNTLESSIFGFPFPTSAGLVFWVDNYSEATQAADGYIADPADCMRAKRKFSTSLDFWFLNGDKMIVYSDDSDGQVVTIRYAPLTEGGMNLGPAVEVQKQVGRLFGVLPDYEGVIFNVSDSGDLDGLYHYAIGATPPAGDAGAPADTGAPADAATTD